MKKTSVWPPTSMHLVVCYKGFGIEKEKKTGKARQANVAIFRRRNDAWSRKAEERKKAEH